MGITQGLKSDARGVREERRGAGVRQKGCMEGVRSQIEGVYGRGLESDRRNVWKGFEAKQKGRT